MSPLRAGISDNSITCLVDGAWWELSFPEWIYEWGSSSETAGIWVQWASPLPSISLQLPQLQTDPKVPSQGSQQSPTKITKLTEGETSAPRALSSEPGTGPAQLCCPRAWPWHGVPSYEGTPSSSPWLCGSSIQAPSFTSSGPLSPPTAFSGTHPSSLYP